MIGEADLAKGPKGRWRDGFERIRRRPAYVGASLLLILTAAVGFVPRMVGALVAGQVPHDWIIHVHVAVYWLWLALFSAQTINAALGRMTLHRKLGKVLITYGVLMFVVGLGVTFNRIFKQINSGDVDVARRVNLEPVVDMVVFPVLFSLAIYFRRKPELHKRLMIVTATQLMYAAVIRIDVIPLKSRCAFLLVWTAPILLGMAHDWFTRRLIHPVYVLGLLLLAVLAGRMSWVDSGLWRSLITGLAMLSNPSALGR